jgi:hypothetical protein
MKSIIKKTISFTAIISFLLANTTASAQGCVAIRGTGVVCTKMEHTETDAKGWQFNASYRYFKSFRHYKGNEEQLERLEQHTEVINWQHTLDLSLVRIFNNRWSVVVGMPLLGNSRSSLYEHGREERHRSGSYGLGDMRVVAYNWLLDPAKNRKGNVQLGVGLKLPTGEENYQDYFQNVGPNKTAELRPVDQSIQLGDGGTALITELNGFYNFSPKLGLYTTLYYMTNPREVNGVRTFRETLNPLYTNEAIMSVPDQYMARLGANYSLGGSLHGASVLLGVRLEGIPVHDLVGGSKGFRRPGYIISAEPGISYMVKKLNFFATVPVALERNRTQSVTDKENSLKTGTYRQGDAAFADYSVNVGVSVKF